MELAGIMSATPINSVGVTDTGKVRKANEDAIIRLPEAGLFGVADGMGGTAGGEFASQTVVASVERAASLFRATTTLEERIAALRNAIDQASREIRAWAEHRGIEGTGTTVVMLVTDPQRGDRSVILHAGDSRAYLMRGGRLQQLTRDHSVAESFGNGRDEDVPALFRNVVTNAIGLSNNVRLEETPLTLRRGDLAMVCSDGLYRMVKDDDIAVMLNAQTPIADRAAALLQAALDHGGKDNVSIVLAQVPEPAAGESGEAEAETHDTEVRSAREASRQIRQPTQPSATHDSTIVGRSITDEAETHDRTPVVPAAPISAAAAAAPAPSTKPKTSRATLLTAAGAALVLILLLMWKMTADPESPATPALEPPAAFPLPVAPAPAPEPVDTTPTESAEARILRADTTGDWNLAPGLIDQLDPVEQSMMIESAKAWQSEWNRTKAQPDQALAELTLFRSDLEKVVQLWLPDYVMPALDVWSDDPARAATIYCLNRNRIQDRMFSLLDTYVTDVMQVLGAFGDQPTLVESRLRAASISRDAEPPSLEKTLQELRNLARGLNRWKEKTRHLPVGIAEARNVSSTFIAPLEYGVRGVLQEIATYLAEIPTLSSILETRPAVRSFYDQKDQYLAEISRKAHHTSAGRETLIALLRDLFYAPGLQDIASSGMTGAPPP
jgi:serine/threonine protein phosphatase PrpC